MGGTAARPHDVRARADEGADADGSSVPPDAPLPVTDLDDACNAAGKRCDEVPGLGETSRRGTASSRNTGRL
jgi:hypothetical protein